MTCSTFRTEIAGRGLMHFRLHSALEHQLSPAYFAPQEIRFGPARNGLMKARGLGRVIGRKSYRMSFSTGGLFVNESIEIASYFSEVRDWNIVAELILSLGKLKLPKVSSNRRTAREIINRLSCLGAEELVYLVDGADRSDQLALLWLAFCRAYPFVREFMTEVVSDRLHTYRHDLPVETFDMFFDEKAEQVETLGRISKATRQKLKQVLFRVMREAGVIDKQNQIIIAYLNSPIRNLIEESNPLDLAVFPGQG